MIKRRHFTEPSLLNWRLGRSGWGRQCGREGPGLGSWHWTDEFGRVFCGRHLTDKRRVELYPEGAPYPEVPPDACKTCEKQYRTGRR